MAQEYKEYRDFFCLPQVRFRSTPLLTNIGQASISDAHREERRKEYERKVAIMAVIVGKTANGELLSD